jgi:hypothetical protein
MEIPTDNQWISASASLSSSTTSLSNPLSTPDDWNRCHGTIVVLSKCPIAGKSKTRLIPLLGEQGSVQLATAMLSDVLTTLVECVSDFFPCFVLFVYRRVKNTTKKSHTILTSFPFFRFFKNRNRYER